MCIYGDYAAYIPATIACSRAAGSSRAPLLLLSSPPPHSIQQASQNCGICTHTPRQCQGSVIGLCQSCRNNLAGGNNTPDSVPRQPSPPKQAPKVSRRRQNARVRTPRRIERIRWLPATFQLGAPRRNLTPRRGKRTGKRECRRIVVGRLSLVASTRAFLTHARSTWRPSPPLSRPRLGGMA